MDTRQVGDYYKIDSILTLVDCKHVKEHLDEVKADDAVNEAVSQIAFADRVLLNKTDLVTPEQLEEVRQLRLAPTDAITLTQRRTRTHPSSGCSLAHTTTHSRATALARITGF